MEKKRVAEPENSEDKESLIFHLKEVLKGNRRFENAYERISRMFLSEGVAKIVRDGKTINDFLFFRQGEEHIIGLFEVLNKMVNAVKDGAEGGSSKKMVIILVGEAGNGKTFCIDYIQQRYRKWLAQPGNERYTFQFINLKELGGYGNIAKIESQTFEDPMILAMNIFPSREKTKDFLRKVGFKDEEIDSFFKKYAPLGADSEAIWKQIFDFCGGDIEKALQFVRVVLIPISESSGVITGKYTAGDKITSSKTELVGKRDLARILQLADVSHPYVYNVRMGAIARAAGGGIHFSDEMFRNKPDLVQVYLDVIQNRNIILDGNKWPIDCLILATSNNNIFNDFIAQAGEAPIRDRCLVIHVPHNTDYKLQQELTRYALGGKKTTINGEPMHEDPNLIYVASVAVCLTRLPRTEKLDPIEIMKLEAGEIAGEKSVKTLVEVKEILNANPDVTKRWGQKGLSHRALGRALQILNSLPESHEGKCMFAKDFLDKAIEQVILDEVVAPADREKFLEDVKKYAKRLYRERIKTSIYNAYRDDPDAIRKDVLAYINMIIGIDSDRLGPDKIWRYKDPQTGEWKPIKIDENFINSVEERMGLNTKERKEEHRTSMRKIYSQNIVANPNYDFMDNEKLVKAVTEVRLKSDVAGAASLVGALANQTNEENVRIRNRILETMLKIFDPPYCLTCAQKTIEFFCEPEED